MKQVMNYNKDNGLMFTSQHGLTIFWKELK